MSIVGFPDRLLVAHMVPWNIDILDGVYRYIPPVDQSKVPDDYVPIFSNYYAVRQSVIDTKTEVRWIATTGPADNALNTSSYLHSFLDESGVTSLGYHDLTAPLSRDTIHNGPHSFSVSYGNAGVYIRLFDKFSRAVIDETL